MSVINELAQKAVETIRKGFGEGAIRQLSDDSICDIEVLPTGSIGLDEALGVGGIPVGRIVEVFGAESSGKTTIALTIAAAVQRQGGVVAFIDVEHSLDPAWARLLGVDTNGLLLAQPDSAEEALEIVERLLRDTAVRLVVLDSVAALVPRAEIEGEMGANHPGLQARLMSQALRKLTPAVKHGDATLLFINQIRMKIGVTFGSPETTSGGRALKFYASIRIKVRRLGALKRGDEVYGNRIKIQIVKNKVAPPHRWVDLDLSYEHGLDRYAELLDYGLKHGLCTKHGAWFNYGDVRLGQGRSKACDYLREHTALADELLATVRGLIAPKSKLSAPRSDAKAKRKKRSSLLKEVA